MKETNNSNQAQEETSAISYDARQGRSILLMQWLEQLSYNQANDNYTAWIKSLKAIHYLCFAFSKKEEVAEVESQLLLAQNYLKLLHFKKNVNPNLVAGQFDKTTKMVLSTYKNHFMQVQKGESFDFDFENFDSELSD